VVFSEPSIIIVAYITQTSRKIIGLGPTECSLSVGADATICSIGIILNSKRYILPIFSVMEKLDFCKCQRGSARRAIFLKRSKIKILFVLSAHIKLHMGLHLVSRLMTLNDLRSHVNYFKDIFLQMVIQMERLSGPL